MTPEPKTDDLIATSVGRVALVVAHGQPSDPEPPEAEIAALAARVAAHLPGWRVLAATLASEPALRRAVAEAGGQPVIVYPLFMADGWFTQTHLPQRLAAAGAGAVTVLAPFGLDPAVQDLTVDLARAAAAGGATELLLAAHGSFRSLAPAAVAQAMAAKIRAGTGLARVETGFIDQKPRVAEVARSLGPRAVCLPFFAARGGHVIDDLPRALAEAGFSGDLLAPVGLDPRVPGLIAAALQASD
jgi:sirohydrochlorin ferrochelatase